MAQANWEKVAWDITGQPTSEYCSPSGIVLRLDKDWVDVEDDFGWREGAFCRPIVAQVREGHVVYRDVELLVLRGPREGGYALAWSRERGTGRLAGGMIGVGLYAFPDESCGVPVGIGELCWFLERLENLPANSRHGWSPGDSVPLVFADVLRRKIHEVTEVVSRARSS